MKLSPDLLKLFNLITNDFEEFLFDIDVFIKILKKYSKELPYVRDEEGFTIIEKIQNNSCKEECEDTRKMAYSCVLQHSPLSFLEDRYIGIMKKIIPEYMSVQTTVDLMEGDFILHALDRGLYELVHYLNEKNQEKVFPKLCRATSVYVVENKIDQLIKIAELFPKDFSRIFNTAASDYVESANEICRLLKIKVNDDLAPFLFREENFDDDNQITEEEIKAITSPKNIVLQKQEAFGLVEKNVMKK